MLHAIDSILLTRITGGNETPSGKTEAQRQCPGGAIIVKDSDGQRWALMNGLWPQKINKDVSDEKFCGAGAYR